MAHRLRQHPADLGLVSGLGWFVTKHALAVWSTTPPDRPFALLRPQQQVDQLPRQPQALDYQGPATIEVATVVHDRQGRPERAAAALRTPAGERVWAQSTHPEVLAGLLETDPLQQPCRLRPGRELQLA
jgi:acetyl-CoA C-acetyltransferase